MDESGGVYIPLSKNDLIFVMRRRDEAEGDRRMIGSGRRLGFEFIASAGLLVALDVWCDLRELKGAASLRT